MKCATIAIKRKKKSFVGDVPIIWILIGIIKICARSVIKMVTVDDKGLQTIRLSTQHISMLKTIIGQTNFPGSAAKEIVKLQEALNGV